MPSNPRQTNPLGSVPAGMRVGNFQFEPIEDEQEKAQRLRKDMLSFYFKDLSVWMLGYLFIVLTGFYCFWVLTRSDATAVDKDRAWSAFMAILGGDCGTALRRGCQVKERTRIVESRAQAKRQRRPAEAGTPTILGFGTPRSDRLHDLLEDIL
jgi:hypothetical protein